MATKFLNKKSWHTGGIKHIEKVWKAEQKHEEEQKKLHDLKRELEEERQIQELRQLQAQGKGAKVERLDWMYEGSIGGWNKPNAAEEYLLGKPFEDPKDKEDSDKLKSAPGSLWLNKSGNSLLDAQAKIRDDPLLEIKKKEKSALEFIRNNPVKMSLLKSEALKLREEKERKKKDKKRKRKEEKRERKERRKRHGSRSASESTSSSDSESRAGHGSISSLSRRPNGAEPSDGERDGHRDKGRDKDGSREQGDGNTSSRREDDRPEGDRHARPVGYGLSFPRGATEPKSTPGTLPPLPDRPDLVAEKRKQVAEMKDRQKRGMTEEERKRRLAEMMQDASVHDKQRWSRLSRDKAKDDGERNKDGSDNKDAVFLKDVRKAVYSEHSETVEDRVRRNAHYRQRGGDDRSFVRR